MAVKLAYNRVEQFSDGAGNPYSGAKLFTYVGGSVNTKQPTYTESTGSTPNTNPIILDAFGQLPQPVWLTTGVTYKFVLAPATDTDPPTSPYWTLDGVTGVNDSTTSVSEWVAGPTPTFVSATSFTLVGDQTSTFTKSRRIKATVTAGTVYGTIINTAFAALTTVTVALDSGALDSGLSAVSYGLISAVNPSIDADEVNRKGTAVVSAATTDIWSIAGDYVHVTGATGPITSLGTAPYAGTQRTVIFDSTPTITHNATSLILPGGASIVAAAGDRMIVRADTTANMMVVDYIRASGQAIVTGSGSWVLIQRQSAAASATIDFATGIDGTYDEYVVTVTDLVPATNATNFWLRISQDAGVSYKAGAGSYRWAYNTVTDAAANVPAGSTASTVTQMTAVISSTASQSLSGWVKFSAPVSTTSCKKVRWDFSYMDSAATFYFVAGGGAYTADTAAVNAIRFMMSAGNITSGALALYGIRKA